jgi:type VI secretion system protein ImpJ
MSSPVVDRRGSLERRRPKLSVAARDLPAAIQWHEGMLLEPQHFQSMAQRQEMLVHYHAASTSPYHWGVLSYEVDRALLLKGVFRVTELEAILPDGLIVSYIAGDGPDLSTDLANRIDDMKQSAVTVSLAVAARGRGVRFDERYSSEESEPMRDENTGEGEARFSVLRPRLQLLADDPPLKYVHFPLAKISFRNQFTMTSFEPPQLRVSPGSAIYRNCQAIATNLRDKAINLSRTVDSPSASSSESQILGTKSLIHCLVGELPLLEALLATGTAHPFSIYLALCSVVGHVAGLGRMLVPPVLMQYDHNDLAATFESAQMAIARAVSEGVHESYSEYRFTSEQDEFRLRFDEEWTSHSLILGVRAPAGVSEADMAAWVASSVIGGRSQILGMRDRRVTGVRRRRIDSEADLVPSRGVTLFVITPDPQLISTGEDLVILSPRDDSRPRPEEIVLYVKNPAPAPDPATHVPSR